MAYKTVRRNGKDVLINTNTGQVVQPGQRVANELSWLGKGITDNFTYSDKTDPKTGRRLTPAEVRRVEGAPKPKPKPSPSRGQASKPKPSAPKPDPEFSPSRKGGGDAASLQMADSAVRSLRQPRQTSRPAQSGSRSSSSSTTAKPSSRPTPSAQSNTYQAPGGTDKERGLAQWAMANKGLAAAASKRQADRGTSRSSNPLMKDMMDRIKQREDANKPTPPNSSKAEYNVSQAEGMRRLQEGTKPAPSATPATNSTTASTTKSGSEKLKDALDQKQREKRKQQQQQLLATRKPGSRY